MQFHSCTGRSASRSARGSRLERDSLATAAPPNALVLTGTVEDRIFTGDTILMGIETSSGRVVASAKNTGRWHPPAEGTAVTLWWRPSDMVAFGADGNAISD